jgi:hypothetical protein
MYLLKALHNSIFVSTNVEYTRRKQKNVIPLKFYLPIAVCWLLATVHINAQEMWPGDVNNNGVVNNVDIVYWAYARDAVGAARVNADSSWEAQDLSNILWDDYFPDSLNFAYADCNGNGIIEDDDLNIIKQHYWFKRDSVAQEDYTAGIPGIDPPLSIIATDPLTAIDETENLSLSLGNENMPIDSMFGLVFSLSFDSTEVQGSEENAGFMFSFSEGSWINGTDNEQASETVIVDRSLGVASVAIYRDHPDFLAGGWGDFANFQIVIEDVIFLTIEIDLDSAYYIDQYFNKHPLAVEGAVLATDSLELGNGSGTPGGGGISGPKIFPNPFKGRVFLELPDKGGNKMEHITLYGVEGRLLDNWKLEEPVSRTSIELADYPNGMYLLEVKTEQGTVVKKLVISSNTPGGYH